MANDIAVLIVVEVNIHCWFQTCKVTYRNIKCMVLRDIFYCYSVQWSVWNKSFSKYTSKTTTFIIYCLADGTSCVLATVIRQDICAVSVVEIVALKYNVYFCISTLSVILHFHTLPRTFPLRQILRTLDFWTFPTLSILHFTHVLHQSSKVPR